MKKFIAGKPTERSSLHIWTIQCGGGVDIVLEDPDDPGVPWTIATVAEDGIMHLHRGLERAGLATDHDGYIKVERG